MATHTARADLLRRRRLVHMSNGGRDPRLPMPPKKRTRAELAEEAPASWPPMLPVAGEPHGHAGALTWSDLAQSDLLALEDKPPSGSVGGGEVEERGSPAIAGRPGEDRRPRRSGQGGSVYLTFLNSRLRAKRQAAGRKLTLVEIMRAREDSRAQWQRLPTSSRQAYTTTYKAQARRRQHGEGSAAIVADPPSRYVPHFESGTRTFPMTAGEFIAQHKAKGGYPSSEEVYHPGGKFIVGGPDLLAEGLAGHVALHVLVRCG